jgi:hypothetical protein
MIKVKLLEKKREGNYKRLAVFDFDGTLFKSPERPKGHRGNWWASKDSLDYPHVPKRPDDDYWHMNVVRAAKENISDSKTYCIMLTGRLADTFQERVDQLLDQKGLEFDEHELAPRSAETADFKIAKIKSILKKYKSIQELEMWDDDLEKIELYKEEFGDMLTIHHIK